MNKTMKKIAAAITTAVMAAIPMAGSLTANASTLPNDTLYYEFGDVNGDHCVTVEDAQTVSQWVFYGKSNQGPALRRRADVNGDGHITQADADKILAFAIETNTAGNDVLGDVNGDGEVDFDDAFMLEQYVSKHKHAGKVDLIRADVNCDGVINKCDHALIGRYLLGQLDTLYIRWGDVNGDTVVTALDSWKLGQYINMNSSVTITDAQLRRADINNDGNVDTKDLTYVNYYTNYLFFPDSVFFS